MTKTEQFKDSGTRRDFGTGAVRDAASGKGRFDLVPYDAIQQLAIVYETGCNKYGDRNWEKGIPVWTFLDSASRHLAKAVSGHTDEPHLPMAMWNIACAIQTLIWVNNCQLPQHLGYCHEIRLCGQSKEKAPDESEASFDKWEGLFVPPTSEIQ